MELISAKKYDIEMKDRVLPYLNSRKEAGLYERIPGQRLYYEQYSADNPKGTVVIVHGFSEAIGKFYETAYYFLTEGYHVWMFQQREHGKSFRSTPDKALIYIENYEDLILDLKGFVTDVVKKNPKSTGLPVCLFAHSMGGGVGACCLERYPELFDKAVLTSPMLEVNSGSMPAAIAIAYLRLQIRAKRGRSYMPGFAPFSGKPDFANSCTNCKSRYDYWFRQQLANTDYQMCVAAVRTIFEFFKLTKEAVSPENCRKVKAKVLLFQAGHDSMVKAAGQDAFISMIGKPGQKVVMPRAKHEIYLGNDSDLDIYWEHIFEFLK